MLSLVLKTVIKNSPKFLIALIFDKISNSALHKYFTVLMGKFVNQIISLYTSSINEITAIETLMLELLIL